MDHYSAVNLSQIAAWRYGHVTGPAFFDTDLTAAKNFKINQALQSSSAAANSHFGCAPLKEGRRILELGLRYSF